MKKEITCINCCGLIADNLDVHHIVPFREFGLENYKKANRLENLISLCHSCHLKSEYEKIVIV